jgi:hypothetical protein
MLISKVKRKLTRTKVIFSAGIGHFAYREKI